MSTIPDPFAMDDDIFEEVIEDDPTAFSPRALLDEVMKLEDIIVTIPATELNKLKNSLMKRKARDNAKMKSAGVPIDTRVLSFNDYPALDAEGKPREGLLDVRIKIGERKSLTVLEIRKPSDDL